MCYYNGVKVTRAERIRLLDLEAAIRNLQDLDRQLQNGFSYENYPIIKPLQGGKAIDLELAHWELIPAWAKNMQSVIDGRKYNTLNAVGEELFEKATYKDAALKRRCLVLSSGFYEWRHYKPEGSKKDESYPYYVTLPGREYFFMAGIYQPWTDRETGETMDTFSIVTTKANHLMEQVHNKKKRMPTILTDELAYEWIQDGLTKERITEIATFQYPADQMAAYPIYKDFRALEDPTAPFTYSELPALVA